MRRWYALWHSGGLKFDPTAAVLHVFPTKRLRDLWVKGSAEDPPGPRRRSVCRAQEAQILINNQTNTIFHGAL
jgi:hypothetical protein